jgi:DNA repair protein RecO
MTRGAPLEADAILLSSQPHREHDLFLRAFVRGHGVLGFHVSGGRGSKRRDAGSLQPFVLGRLRADGRGILRQVEPTAAMHRSKLARDPLRYYAANLLAELYLPLPVEPSNDRTFDELWADMRHLHVHNEAPDTGFLVAAIGRLLRSAGVLPDPMHCSRCGCGLILARAGSQGFRCVDCAGSEAHAWSNPGWSAAALALLRAPDLPKPSEPERATNTAPMSPLPAIPTSNVTDLLRLAETLFGKEPRSWKGLAGLLGRRQRLLLAAEGAA